jgi:hypothetical protein
MDTGEKFFASGYPVLLMAVIFLALKWGAPDECQLRLLVQQASQC